MSKLLPIKDENSDEFKGVQKLFNKVGKIKKIFKVVNPEDKLINFKQFSKENENMVESNVFHGTKQRFVSSILKYGFLIELNKASRKGVGTYFSRNCVKSDSYIDFGSNVVKCMFVCDVVIENDTKIIGDGEEIVIENDDAILMKYFICY